MYKVNILIYIQFHFNPKANITGLEAILIKSRISQGFPL